MLPSHANFMSFVLRLYLSWYFKILESSENATNSHKFHVIRPDFWRYNNDLKTKLFCAEIVRPKMIENATQFMQFSWLTNISKSDPQRDRKFTSHADRKLFQFRLHIRTQNSKRQNPPFVSYDFFRILYLNYKNSKRQKNWADFAKRRYISISLARKNEKYFF